MAIFCGVVKKHVMATCIPDSLGPDLEPRPFPLVVLSWTAQERGQPARPTVSQRVGTLPTCKVLVSVVRGPPVASLAGGSILCLSLKNTE